MFEDMRGDPSDDDCCHRNFRKTVYICFCHILQFGKTKELRKSDLATLSC